MRRQSPRRAPCGTRQSRWTIRPPNRYLIQTRGIPEPAGGFPSDVAWHPGERALILAARLPTGDLTAVQLIRLTAVGIRVGGGASRQSGQLGIVPCQRRVQLRRLGAHSLRHMRPGRPLDGRQSPPASVDGASRGDEYAAVQRPGMH
jgi:hypothetical protein